MKVEKSISMHLYAFERPCKRRIVTDPKSHNASHIQQYLNKATFLSDLPGLYCILEETMSGESMAQKVISKVNARLKFLHQKNKYLTPNLRCLLCIALIQPHFDYACSAWYPNLSKKLKSRIQTSQIKCICFSLQLDKMSHISKRI